MNKNLICRSWRFMSTNKKVSFRIPKEMVKSPRHRSYEQSEYPSGSAQDKMKNFVGDFPKRFARPIVPVQYLFKGDYVYILWGPDKGKRGVIEQVLQNEAKVFVSGRNCRWEKRDMGLRVEYRKVEDPLLMQHVSLIDPQSQQPANIDFKYNEIGELVRVSQTSGRIIPYPEVENRSVQADGPNDTPKDLCEQKTYNMELESFEDSILREVGLEHEIEQRSKKHPTWFY